MSHPKRVRSDSGLCTSICFCKSDFEWKLFPQSVHVYVFPWPRCTFFSWLLLAYLHLNALSQKLHLNFRSLLCRDVWSSRADLQGNAFSHISHLNRLSLAIFLWVIATWQFSSDWVGKAFGHSAHLCVWRPVCRKRWAFRPLLLVKLIWHTGHTCFSPSPWWERRWFLRSTGWFVSYGHLSHLRVASEWLLTWYRKDLRPRIHIWQMGHCFRPSLWDSRWGCRVSAEGNFLPHRLQRTAHPSKHGGIPTSERKRKRYWLAALSLTVCIKRNATQRINSSGTNVP